MEDYIIISDDGSINLGSASIFTLCEGWKRQDLLLLILSFIIIISILIIILSHHRGGGDDGGGGGGIDDGFNLNVTENHLLNAFAASCSAEALYNWDCYWCNQTKVNVTHIFQNSETEIYGYVGIDMKLNNIVVAVRGTIKTSLANWIENIDFIKINPYPSLHSLLVHRGFWDSYLSISDQLAVALREAVNLCPDCSYTAYVGHSLGAAVVSIAAVDISFTKNNEIIQPPPIIFSFGQPRIGNSDWASFHGKYVFRTNRVVHDRDPIPHLPLQSMGFTHSPIEYWEIDLQTIKECSSSNGEDSSCSDSIGSPSLTDHYIYLGYDHRLGQNFQC